jgi:hypothetical protein
MAYNDGFWLMVPMFVIAMPLLLLLPRHGLPPEARAESRGEAPAH